MGKLLKVLAVLTGLVGVVALGLIVLERAGYIALFDPDMEDDLDFQDGEV